MNTKHLFGWALLLAGATLVRADDGMAAACCAVESAPATAAAAAPAALSPHSLYQLEATWTDDAGRPVALATLRGRPVVLAMIFTRCEYACPTLVADLQRLRNLLPAKAREETQFVLVSFDPEHDTPEALHAYRERLALDDSWTLLRGDANAVQDLAMLLGVRYKQDARGQFSHSNLFTVLNAGGEIVHQHAGLRGDVSEAAKTVSLAFK